MSNRKEWIQSKKGKKSIRKYNQSKKGKENQRRYRNSILGKKKKEEYYDNCKKIMRDLKINGCSICGYDRYLGSLDFHHVDEEQKKYYLNMKNIGNKNIVEELNKCILLCSNCHREIHKKE